MSLSKLIALQKAGTTGVKNETVGVAGAIRPQTSESVEAGNPDDGTQPDELPSGEAPAQESVAGEAAPDAPRKLGLGLNLVGAGRAVGSKAAGVSDSSVAERHGSGAKPDNDSGPTVSAEFSLEDLAGFEATDETAPTRPQLIASGFEDEIEATAPERPVDPSLSVQQQSFIESLDGIYPVLHDPELFGQAVRIIMLELQEHPEYKPLLADQDVHTMIRGMRNTMGLARIRKQEKSRKTGGATKKAARGKSAVSDDDMALLDSLLGGD